MTTQRSKALSPAQRERFAILVGQLGATRAEFEAAKRAQDVAQNNASGFVDYCMQELGVPVGEGWTFVQAELRFVSPAQGEN